MWIVTYRDFAIAIGNIGDEEVFIHSSSKVYILLLNNTFDFFFIYLFIYYR